MERAEIVDGAFAVLTGFAAREGLGAPTAMMVAYSDDDFFGASGVAVEWKDQDRRTAVRLPPEAARNGAFEALKTRVSDWVRAS